MTGLPLWFITAVAGALGLAVGSFVNVVLDRVPRRESIVTGRSHCDVCGSTLLARDNIPVVSWIVLRGRCRTCGASIPFRSPAVEAAFGAGFAAAPLGAGSSILALLALVGVLVLVAARLHRRT